MVSDTPGASVSPALGGPLAVNGAEGPVTDWKVSVLVPVLVTPTVSISELPTALVPQSRLPGDAASPGCVPVPVAPRSMDPESVLRVTFPVTVPQVVGVKVTWKLMESPAFRVTGSDGGVTDSGAAAVIADTVTVRVAVIVAVVVAVLPTWTLPKLTAEPCRGCVVGAPKAIRLPSRVPT